MRVMVFTSPHALEEGRHNLQVQRPATMPTLQAHIVDVSLVSEA